VVSQAATSARTSEQLTGYFMSRNGTWQWIVDTESSTIIFQKACQPCLKPSASRSVQCNLLLFQVSTPGWGFPHEHN